ERGVRRRDDDAVLQRGSALAVEDRRVMAEVADALRPEDRRVVEDLELRLERRQRDPDHRQQEERERGHDHDPRQHLAGGAPLSHPNPFRIRRTRIVATTLMIASWM